MRLDACRVVTAAFALVAVLPVNEALAASGRKLYDKGAAAFEKGDYETAAKLFAEAFAIEPDPAYVFSEASAHRRLGSAERAAVLYEKYLEIVPEGERTEQRGKARAYAAAMRLAAAKAMKERGDCGAALDEVHKAIAHDKTGGEAWVLFADCTAERGDESGARSGYERALSTPGLSPELREYAESRIAVLAAPVSGPVLVATLPAPEDREAAPAKKRGVPVVAGVSGGVVAVAAAVVVIVLVGRSGSLELPDTTLGVMGWSTR